MTPSILIVEDELAQAQILQYNLEAANFTVTHAINGEDGLAKAQEILPDLILLDWMLPDMPGTEVCAKIRTMPDTKEIPVIMLTARGSEDDKVRGLNIGADDYVVKPYSIRTLIARIKANLRKSGLGKIDLTFGDITMNTLTYRVQRDGASIKLGPTEFRLLKTFLAYPKKVWSRAQLLDHVWGTDVYVDDRTVDVHIGRLRRAMNIDNKPDIIRTVRGAGYALDTEK
ncbi:MAG: phosphate regulon transcriptional regulatory protein PhoB [Robiginitomaculum sp.]|nr:MAG: phosphate regulon transcriptional regulatory protein PhoB [Robiginitomaculum sp.]